MYMYVYMHLSTTFTMHTFTMHTFTCTPSPSTHTLTRSKNVVLNYSDAEAKVREATSNDPWGPSSAIMMELSEYTFHV